MGQALNYAYSQPSYAFFVPEEQGRIDTPLRCSWHEMRAQLLQQWNRLTEKDVDAAGSNRHKIALLIQREYGISARLVENYLQNFERTLPIM